MRQLPGSKISSAVDLEFPMEIWRIVFAEVDDQTTLARLLLLHPALYSDVEETLYRCITLTTDKFIILLSESTASHTRRGLLTFALHVLTEVSTVTAPLCLASLMRFLDNLRDLTLCVPGLWSPLPSWDYGGVHDVLGVRFKNLRRLDLLTDGPSVPSVLAIPDFLQNHGKTLKELDIRAVHAVLSQRTERKLSCPALRALSCTSLFIQYDFHGARAKRLTHLHLEYASPLCLQRVPIALRLRLLSLRLSDTRSSYVTQWSVLDLLQQYPRLIFLQVDMCPRTTPYISDAPIDWERDRLKTNANAYSRTTPITILWTSSLPNEVDGAADIASREYIDKDLLEPDEAWRAYLNAGATRVLKDWRSYIRRVVYRHGKEDYISASLSEESNDVVLERDTEMHEDYWKVLAS
ncbi:hypothetical protein C8Q74DRAFT_1368134 [Fomes fomentarius]|nr:hypothetical protein C8Q74DRAFT_1368134 [Fomes fomentarius]